MPVGRHSEGSDLHFYASFARWILPWVLVASVVGAIVWIGVDLMSGDIAPPSPEVVVGVVPSETPTPSESPTIEPPSTPKEKKTPRSTPTPTQPPPLITAGITVQVLNGTGVPDANDRMADRLDALGFDVLNLEGANRAYSQTTVFWSFPEAEPAAARLAERFGWAVAPKPDNLSSQVHLHVVVGADEV